MTMTETMRAELGDQAPHRLAYSITAVAPPAPIA